MRTLTCVAVLATLAAAPDPVAATAPAASVADRFLTRPEPQVSSYRAMRRLVAANEKRKISGWIEAITDLDPVSGFRYRITEEGGSRYIRAKVLIKVLEAERAMHARSPRDRVSLTADNYVFGDASEDPSGLLIVPITSRRRSEMLVNGFMVLSPDADLVRIEGRLSKNPSFWTRRVDVVRRYARANGVRVPVEMSSRVQVLVVGDSTFSMCIDYELINGEPVLPRTSCP